MDTKSDNFLKSVLHQDEELPCAGRWQFAQSCRACIGPFASLPTSKLILGEGPKFVAKRKKYLACVGASCNQQPGPETGDTHHAAIRSSRHFDLDPTADCHHGVRGVVRWSSDDVYGSYVDGLIHRGCGLRERSSGGKIGPVACRDWRLAGPWCPPPSDYVGLPIVGNAERDTGWSGISDCHDRNRVVHRDDAREQLVSETSLQLIERWREGDETAAQEIYNRYVARLIALAGSRISPRLARRVEAEDVVQSVYKSFFARTNDDRLVIGETGQLWGLLAAITINKIRAKARFHGASKRSVDAEASISASLSCYGLAPTELAGEPSAEEAAALAEQYEMVAAQMNEQQRQVFQLYLDNMPVDDIANEIRRSARTVRRELDQIRRLLVETLNAADSDTP